jgi:outer membrane protein OmpA-like peptidoglycan-associated protein
VIRDSAFAHLNSLTSLTIGTGLTTLEASSFYNLISVLTTFRYCGYGSFNFSAAGLGAQIPPICVISKAVNGVSFEISSSLPIDDQNNVYVRLSDLDLVDSLTVSAMLGPDVLNVAAVYGGGGGCETFNLAESKECIRQNMGIETAYFDVNYQALSESNSESITVRVRSVPNLAPEISYRQPIFKGRVQPEVQIDADLPYRFLHIGFQNEVITYSETETVNGLFENDRYRIYTGETGLKVKQIWTTADADTHINFHGTAPSSGSITVTIKAGAFIASYPTYASNALVIPINGCDGITAVCAVGDTGPGGGKIFYVETDPNGFASEAPECSPRCKYLEAAPVTGRQPLWIDEFYVWSANTNTLGDATGTGIGAGYANTIAMIAQSDSPNFAGTASRSYVGPYNQTDWYLPSAAELASLFVESELVQLDSEGGAEPYWSSTELNNESALADSGEEGSNQKNLENKVRPIRALGYVTPAGISGVTAPVKDATPVEIVALGNGYTGTISWASSSGALVGNFLPATVYTATVTLTARAGYTFNTITQNFFTVESATATNPAGSGVVTAIFPATGGGAPAPAQDPVEISVPSPRQQSKVLSINPASAPELTQTTVVISGEFAETVVNILIGGVELPAGAWKQTQNQVSFTIPVKKAGSYSIQLYNGSIPLLEPLSFSFTLASESSVQTPITKPSPNSETEISKEIGQTTNSVKPEASKPLQKTVVTRIYFDLGSSAINMASTNTLKNLAKRISGLGSSIKISVTGFAQPTPGSEKTDLALSKRRAASVAKALRNFGVNTKVTYAGAGRALKNVPSSRYVEIVVTNR